MKNKFFWTVVEKSAGSSFVTYRARVPGGWLYRQYSILLEIKDALTGQVSPTEATETMCFVPDTTRAERGTTKKRIARVQSALREVYGLLSAHEDAIKADSGNTNWSVMKEKVIAALAEEL